MPRIQADISCGYCGGGLLHADLDGLCPGCHAPVGDSVQVAAVDLTDLTVRSDVPCVNCGYNLKTLPVAGSCPECAAAVALSFRRDRLAFADMAWLRRVRDGCIELGLGAMLLLLALVPLLGFARVRWFGSDRGHFMLFASLVVGLILTLGGLHNVAAKRVRCGGLRSRSMQSNWTRLLIYSFVGCTLLLLLPIFVPIRAWWLGSIGWVIAFLLFTGCLIGGAWRLRELAMMATACWVRTGCTVLLITWASVALLVLLALDFAGLAPMPGWRLAMYRAFLVAIAVGFLLGMIVNAKCIALLTAAIKTREKHGERATST